VGDFSRQKLTGRNYFSSWECEPTRSTFSSRGHPIHLMFSCSQLDANVPQDDFCNGKHMFWALMHMFQLMIFLLKHKFCALKHSYFPSFCLKTLVLSTTRSGADIHHGGTNCTSQTSCNVNAGWDFDKGK
jgi:hypothetical protein